MILYNFDIRLPIIGMSILRFTIILQFLSLHTCDYYSILGLKRDATDQDIKKNYRKLALELHPDKISVNETEEYKAFALEKFLAIKEAYEILIDHDKRIQYDQVGSDDNKNFVFESVQNDVKIEEYKLFPFKSFISSGNNSILHITSSLFPTNLNRG